MNARTRNRQTVCVTFSGIDGAGKSTQIDALRDAAEQAGLSVHTVRFWDDVARLTSLRETSGHKLFKGDKGIGSPDSPINRRDKNVRSWPMSCVRIFIYTIDAFSTRVAISKARRSGADICIFDRYLYDELANLTLTNPLMRLYARWMMALTPRPDVSFILDADPQAARARKPEYPLEFIHMNREAYLELSRILGGITVVPAMPIEDVKRTILSHVMQFHSLSPARVTDSAVADFFSAEPDHGDETLSRPAA